MRTYTRKKLPVQEIENVQSLCRLCLGKTEEMTAIFSTNADDVFSGLPMRIGMCLGLEVSRDDALPKLICKVCITELDKFYAFKKNCAAIYWKLKATLLPVKQTDRNIDNDDANQKEPMSALYLDNDEKSNDMVLTDSSQSSDRLEISIELPTERSPRSEDHLTVEMYDNEKNITILPDRITIEKEDCFNEMSEGTESLTEYPLTVDLEIEQDFVNDNQSNDVSHAFDVKQPHEDVKSDKSDNMQTAECLPEYIVTTLIEKGVLAKRDDTLEILDDSIRTFSLEAACGSDIIMELVEEDPGMPTEVSSKLSSSKAVDPNLKKDGGGRYCGTCGARFASRGALERHLRVHSGEKPYPCRVCGRRFAQREVLRRHELVHSEKLPYQCTWCPKAYTQRGALDAHERSHAPPDARPLVLHRCSRCPKVFLYPSGLSRHMSVHQGRDFPCDECPRTFNDKSSLQRHRRAHQRARPR